ncbi:MAG: hypothetical protein IJX09_03940, partial [Clostridia bacterium]|nr:hypothetical protein [Clostridia bacterium]
AGLKNFADDKEYIQIIGYENAGTSDVRAKVTYYLFEVSEGKATLVGSVVPTDANCAGYSFRTDGQYVVLYGNIVSSGLDSNPDSVTFSYEAPQTTLAALINGLADNYAFKADLKTALNIQDEIPDDGDEKPDDGNTGVAKLSAEATLNKIQATNGVTAEGATNQFVSFDMGAKGGNVWIMTQFKCKNAPKSEINAAANGLETWNSANASDARHNAGVLLTNSSEYNAEYLQVFNTTNTSSGKARANLGDAKAAGLKNFDDSKEYIQIIGYEDSGDASKAKITYYLFEVSNGKITLVQSFVPTQANCATYSFSPYGQYVVLYGNIQSTGLDSNPDSISFSYEAPQTSLAALINGLSEDYAFKADLKTALSIE